MQAINLLTEDVVLAATAEIQVGKSIQLDWPLNNLQFPGFGRKPFGQKVIDLTHHLDNCGFDDEIYINTQSGSQWDSLKHVRYLAAPVASAADHWQYAYQAGKLFYNGLKYEDAVNSNTNGIHSKCIEKGSFLGC